MDRLINECKNAFQRVREISPLVHNITNYVTANDVANIQLAMGASPIMADDCLECAEITAIAKALTINIGTLNSRTVESMLISGKTGREQFSRRDTTPPRGKNPNITLFGMMGICHY